MTYFWLVAITYWWGFTLNITVQTGDFSDPCAYYGQSYIVESCQSFFVGAQ